MHMCVVDVGNHAYACVRALTRDSRVCQTVKRGLIKQVMVISAQADAHTHIHVTHPPYVASNARNTTVSKRTRIKVLIRHSKSKKEEGEHR